MTKAQEFSIQVQSEDPEKKEKPTAKEPISTTSNDEKDGEELVRVQ
jgi:hypothetical protein